MIIKLVNKCWIYEEFELILMDIIILSNPMIKWDKKIREKILLEIKWIDLYN